MVTHTTECELMKASKKKTRNMKIPFKIFLLDVELFAFSIHTNVMKSRLVQHCINKRKLPFYEVWIITSGIRALLCIMNTDELWHQASWQNCPKKYVSDSCQQSKMRHMYFLYCIYSNDLFIYTMMHTYIMYKY